MINNTFIIQYFNRYLFTYSILYYTKYNFVFFTYITGQLELKLRSQVIQRCLPRPPDTNIVLRPLNSEPPLTDLQKVIYQFHIIFKQHIFTM